MTGRERVLCVLNRKTPDKIPFEIGGTDCSSVHVLPYKKLKAKLGLPDKPVKCGCLMQVIAATDNEVMDALDTDAEMLLFGSRKTKIWNAPFGVRVIGFLKSLIISTHLSKSPAFKKSAHRTTGPI